MHSRYGKERNVKSMTNNEKFNRLINSCENPRMVYNALLALAEPSAQKPNDVTDKREIIVGKLSALLNQPQCN